MCLACSARRVVGSWARGRQLLLLAAARQRQGATSLVRLHQTSQLSHPVPVLLAAVVALQLLLLRWVRPSVHLPRLLRQQHLQSLVLQLQDRRQQQHTRHATQGQQEQVQQRTRHPTGEQQEVQQVQQQQCARRLVVQALLPRRRVATCLTSS